MERRIIINSCIQRLLRVKEEHETSCCEDISNQLMEMVETKRDCQICTQQLDVPELIHRIQSLLPLKEAARTCVLSKSWLHAWSTIPNLRFRQFEKRLSNKQMRNYISLICLTLGRYLRDNLPITRYDLKFSIEDKKWDSLIYKCVQLVAPKTCLKDLYLKLRFVKVNITFTLPDEIFSGENLNRISISSVTKDFVEITRSLVVVGSNPVIKCANLRKLKLYDVYISEEVLHNVLSKCCLLEKINLSLLEDSQMTLKVKNLPYLRKLKISVIGKGNILKIYDLPSLQCLHYCNIGATCVRKSIVFNTNLLGNMRELVLEFVTVDDYLVDIINSKFPFLESLTLYMIHCRLGIIDITCVSLKNLIINLVGGMQIDIKVYASKLQSFHYEGTQVPGLMFPSGAPHHISLTFRLYYLIDQLFFVKMREVVNLPSKFNIKIDLFNSCIWTGPFNINNMRSRVRVPAINVEQLSLWVDSDKRDWVNFFDALFSVIHPNYVKVKQSESVKKIIAKLMLELKTRKEYWPDLKDVEIENYINGKWETLTSSWISSPTGLSCLDNYVIKFKLSWCPSSNSVSF